MKLNFWSKMKNKISLNDIALFFQIDRETAQICLENALSELLKKEIITVNDSLCYQNEHHRFTKVRITNQTLSKIKNFFEQEVIQVKNQQLKNIFFGTHKLINCHVVSICEDFFELVADGGGFKGRLHFSNTLPKTKISIGDALLLKIKSLVKIKGEVLFVATQCDYDLYVPYIYDNIDKYEIIKVKIDFANLKIIISFRDIDYKSRNDLMLSISLIKSTLKEFNILTKYQRILN